MTEPFGSSQVVVIHNMNRLLCGPEIEPGAVKCCKRWQRSRPMQDESPVQNPAWCLLFGAAKGRIKEDLDIARAHDAVARWFET